MRTALAVLAATLVVAAGSACGGGDDDSDAGSTAVVVTDTHAPPATRPEPELARSRWASQADAACKPIQDQIDAVPPPANAAGLERWLAATLPLVEQQVAAVKKIKPPVKEEEARRARLFIGGLDKLETAFRKYLAAVRAGDPKRIAPALVAASTAGSETRGYAASLGLTGCGGYSTG